MIIHVVTQEESGGAQRLAVRLCRAHRSAGIPAETWFLYRKHPAFSEEPGVRTLSPGRPTPSRLPALLGVLRRELARADPRAVVAHTHWSNLLVPPVARRAGIARRIAVMHSPLWNLPTASRLAELAAGLCPAATAHVAIAPSIARACPAWVHPVVIPNATEHRAPGDGARMRSRLGLAADARLVVAVGRLSAEKGHQQLIAALACVPGMNLAIAGEGPLAGEMRRSAEDQGVSGRLHLLGALNGPGIADLLAAADVFAMPSRFEGLSLALLEAMQAGCAVVASDIPGNRDALGEGAECAGVFVPPGDSAALTGAVRRVLDDREFEKRLRLAASTRARQFSEQSMISTWHRLLGVA